MTPEELDRIAPLGTIRAICRTVAQVFTLGGTDPKTVDGATAWTWYVNTTVESLRRMPHPDGGTQWSNAPQEYKEFLQLDSPGGQRFREEWSKMNRGELIEGTDLWLPHGYGSKNPILN